MTLARKPHPHFQTKETFITLYNTRLFTAEQVWEMVNEATHTSPTAPYTVEQIADIDKQVRKAAKAAREKVLDEICKPATKENKKDGWELNVNWLVDIKRNIKNEGDYICLEHIESVLIALIESLRAQQERGGVSE